MENRVIEVKFKCQQDAEDLFYSPETHKVYARQRSNATGVVFWCTTSKWSRGYEASCRIREGITMRVLDYKDRVCFEETLVHDDWNGGTSAEKKGPFSDEILKAISEEVAKEYNLKRYEDWSKWLDSFRLQLKYRDSRDDESGEMLDLIFDSRTFDLGCAYGWGGIMGQYMQLNTNVASRFESVITAAETALQDMLDTIDFE